MPMTLPTGSDTQITVEAASHAHSAFTWAFRDERVLSEQHLEALSSDHLALVESVATRLANAARQLQWLRTRTLTRPRRRSIGGIA